MPRIEIDTTLSWGWGLLALVLMGLVMLAYRLRLGPLPRTTISWIWGARTAFMLLVFMLLLNPQLAWRQVVQLPPRIGIFLDNSLSMANHPSAAASTVYAQVSALAEWAREREYEPLLATFGESLELREDGKLEYKPDERLTDFDLLQEWWPTANLAAGFIFSDGVATTGPDPGSIKGPPSAPLFTIGVGDTVANVDLSIDDVHYPLSLLAQEQGEIRIMVRGRNALGQRRRLFIFHEDDLIYSRQVRFGSQDHLETVIAPIVGRLDATHFRIELEVLPDESNIDNNRREIHLDVLPGRRQVALITGALSPNTALISRSIDALSHTRSEHLLFLRGSWRGDEEAFWRQTQDLVVLDNYPSTQLPPGHLDRLLEKIKRDRSAVMIIEGPDNGHRAFVRMLRELGITVEPTGDDASVASPLALVLNSGLAILDRSGLAELIRGDVPPAVIRHSMRPASNRRFSPLIQKSGGGFVAAYGSQGRSKRGLVLMPALMSMRLKLGRTAGGAFVSTVLDAIASWSLEPEGFSPFVIQADRRHYHLGEKVRFRGLQRDRSGTKMLQPILTLEVEGPEFSSLVTLNYVFDSGEYEGEFWPAEAGLHRYRVERAEGGEPMGDWQRFELQAGRVELESLSQNRYGLERLAELNGGAYMPLSNAGSLWEQQQYAPRSVTQESRFNLWQFEYLWVVMIFLLALEWVLRRWVGLL